METLHVRRFRARYRVGTQDPAAPARLDRLLRVVLDRALEPALGSLGISPHELVCLRQVAAPVELDLRESDAAIVDRWAAGLVAGVRAAIEDGREIVRFPSRAAALVDLLLATARDDASRAWAHRQAGLFGDESRAPGERAVAGLVALPDAAPEAIREVARRGALPALVGRLPAGALDAVARSVLVQRRLETVLLDPPEAEASTAPAEVARLGASEEARLTALAGSPFVVAAVRAAPRGNDTAALALLVIAVAAEDPGALRLAPPAVRSLLSNLRAKVRDGAPHRPDRARETRHRGERPAERPVEAVERVVDRPVAEPTDHPVDARASGRTGLGGLAYMLNLLEPSGLAEELGGMDGPLADRPARLVLHAIARRLVPVAADDPAALAFAGLPPGAEPPDLDAPTLREEERAAVADCATRLTALLAGRVGREGESSEALLARVCVRPAEIVADPGWIEVRFPPDAVDTDLRRAGLDVDPGFIAVLGAVVRFLYV